MKPLIKKGCGPNRNRTDICSLGGCCSILLNYGTLCPTLRALLLLTLYKTIYPHGRERSRTRTCISNSRMADPPACKRASHTDGYQL